MKTNNKFKRFFRKTKKTLDSIARNSLDGLGDFIKATIEQKPLLSLFRGTETLLENAFTSLENRIKKNKVKRQEKKIINKQLIDREQLLSDEKHLSKEIFFQRLKELKKSFPIKQLEQELNRE